MKNWLLCLSIVSLLAACEDTPTRKDDTPKGKVREDIKNQDLTNPHP